MSQEQLAERCGVARETISKLESGRRGAYPSTIHKLASGLGVEPRMLVGGVQYLDENEGRETPQGESPESGSPESGNRIGFRGGSAE